MNALANLKTALQSPTPIEKPTRSLAARVRLMAFIADGESEALLKAALSHSVYANPAVMRGGISRAIQYLAVERSPQSIIVDISGVDMPASQLHELAELCEPGVTVIAIGERNDVGLYRDLIRAGATEYIVKPVTVQLLAQALLPASAELTASPISRKLGKMVAVIGARGGVGATTLATNLAWFFATRQNRRVLLLDLDLQNGDCALALGLAPTPGLREALTNPLRIDKVFLERAVAVHSERLFVLSAEEPLRAPGEITSEAIETLVGALRTQYHYIIVDVPRIPTAPYQQALDIAEIRVIVADQTLRSLRDTVRLREMLGEGDAAHRNLIVLNRHGEGGRNAVTLQEIAKFKLQPNRVIPFRPRLITTPGAARRGALTEAVAGLAGEISGRTPERRPWWRLAL